MGGEARNERGSSVGSTLREHRLKQDAGLREVALSLRIRESFLRAIEDGRYERLPGPAYAAGFIRSYAEFLGLDGEDAVRQFRAEAAGMDAGTALQFPMPMSENGVPRGGVILVGLLIAVVAYGGWYVSTIRDRSLVELVAPLPDRFASLVTRRGSEAKTQPQRRAGNAGEDGVAAGGATTRQVAGGAAGEDVTAGAGQEAGGKPEAADRAGENEADTVVADNASTRERALVAAAPAELSADRANSESRGATPTSESSSAARSASNALAAEPSLRDGDDSAKPGTVHAALAGNDSAAANGEGTTQASGRSRIVLKASSLTWVQIKDRDRGRVLMSGLLRQGETYGVPDQRGLRLTVGNAGGLDILVDGLAVQAIGKAGEVRRGLVLDADALGSGNFVFE